MHIKICIEKSIDALQYSQGRKANLNNLNLKNLPGNIQIGDKIRPQFGGPLVAAVTMAPLIQELIYMMMGLDAEGLENQPPEFPHLEVGSSVETAFPSGPSRIEPIKLK